jgi:threonine/homoserine/homoserine lactone efflux protein
MDVSTILWLPKGLLLGLAIAAPVGPIGVLCIRRSLAEGWLTGFLTGMGAATADGFYGGVAAFGLTAVSGLLVAEQGLVRVVGGLALCYLGARTLLAKPAMEAAAARRGRGLLGAYVTTIGLTLTNPATILSFVTLFAALGLAGATRNTVSAPALLTLGVFLGSALWWLALSGGVSLLRTRITSGALRWVNRISGVVLLGFGVVALVSLLTGGH